MFSSVQQKLLLAVGGAVALIFGGAAIFLTTEATDALSEKSGEVLRLESERLASALSGEMRENQKVAETLVSAMERYDKEGASRSEASQMVRRIAEQNPNALGTYLAYEPGGFDGQDYLYEADSASGSNEDGRFAPYWNRYGETLGLSILEDLESQGWYTRPMEAGEPIIKGPFVYDGKMMLSYLHPIERDGEPVGVGGVDVSVDYWQERASQVQIQESGYAFIASSEGRFVAHPIEDWIGDQTLQEAGDSLSIPAFREMSSHLAEGRGGRFRFSDPVTGKTVEAQLRPIEAGGFAVGTVVPREEILAEAHYLRNMFLAIGLVALLVLLGIVYAVLRWSVISPLKEVTEKVQAVAGGDTGAHLDSRRGDEIGQLADSFNQMVGQIREALEEARAKEQEAQEAQQEATRLAETSQEVNNFLRSEIEDLTGRIERLGEGDLTVSFVGGGTGATSKHTDEAARLTGQLRAKLGEAVQSFREALGRVAEATDATASAAAQISSSSDQMAASVEEQSTQAEEVAAAVEELNQTINENAKSAGHVAESAEAGGQEARRGREVVAETAEKMEEIAEVVENTASAMERLGTSSEEIGQVVETIDEIAEQTNLLALNAAIEAARAGGEGSGKTGQGFAVVAEEVRELAERTDEATSEVAEMIDQVQSETSEAVESVREGTRRVEEGMELAEKTRAALGRIVESVEEVGERADEIAAASEEQSTTSEEIARSVQSISTAAQESAAGVTQMSGTADELDSLTERLRAAAGQFELGKGEEPPSVAAESSPVKSSSAEGASSKDSSSKGTSSREGSPHESIQEFGGDGHPSGEASL